MKMISYAQNGEDVMLSRALRGVEHGFYIDVGAAGPTEHSVTRAFYDRGWRGINVEPTERFFDALAAARPRDVNIRAALDATPGERTFYAFEGTGLSTLDPAVAEGHEPGGWPMTTTTVATRTLAGLCAEFAPEVIHFLKVDVEGAEEQVLRGADFARFRPWIVVVEATRPMSPEPDYAAWEPVLTGAAYEFAWFDGLNRFYLAAEQADALRGHFRVPVNYFDDFDLYNPAAERLGAEVAATRARAEAAEAEVARAHAAAAQEAGQAALLRGRNAELEGNVAGLGRRLEECQGALEAQRADYEARLSVQHAHTHHRRLAQEHAEARVEELQARLRFVERLQAPSDPDPAAAPRPAGVRGLLQALYRATLRPVVRPAMWRTRTFLLAGFRREQLTLHEEQRQSLARVDARMDERASELRRHLDETVAALRTVLDRPLYAPPPPPAPPSAELAELAQSMEAALMTLAVTAARLDASGTQGAPG